MSGISDPETPAGPHSGAAHDERRPGKSRKKQTPGPTFNPAQLGQADHQRQGPSGLWVIERHDDSISGIFRPLWDHRGFPPTLVQIKDPSRQVPISRRKRFLPSLQQPCRQFGGGEGPGFGSAEFVATTRNRTPLDLPPGLAARWRQSPSSRSRAKASMGQLHRASGNRPAPVRLSARTG